MLQRAGLYLPERSRLVNGNGPRAAAFLDRDGVIVEDVRYLHRVEQLRVLPGAAEALRRLQERFALVVVTNQSVVARGMVTEDGLQMIHDTLLTQLADAGAAIDAIYYCPHLPDAAVDAYRRDCDCRKPKPGLIERARREWNFDAAASVVIGDADRDVGAARAAGLRCIVVRSHETVTEPADWTVATLAEAATIALGLESA